MVCAFMIFERYRLSTCCASFGLVVNKVAMSELLNGPPGGCKPTDTVPEMVWVLPLNANEIESFAVVVSREGGKTIAGIAFVSIENKMGSAKSISFQASKTISRLA